MKKVISVRVLFCFDDFLVIKISVESKNNEAAQAAGCGCYIQK